MYHRYHRSISSIHLPTGFERPRRPDRSRTDISCYGNPVRVGATHRRFMYAFQSIIFARKNDRTVDTSVCMDYNNVQKCVIKMILKLSRGGDCARPDRPTDRPTGVDVRVDVWMCARVTPTSTPTSAPAERRARADERSTGRVERWKWRWEDTPRRGASCSRRRRRRLGRRRGSRTR